MDFDLIFRAARVGQNEHDLVDIGVKGGRFVAVEAKLDGSGPEEKLDGCLVVPGFVETHIHLDKSAILGRCECRSGALNEAIASVAKAKRGFTEEDVYERASRTLEKAILHGTTMMRTHVEVDPRIGLTSLRALLRLKRDYAWAIVTTHGVRSLAERRQAPIVPSTVLNVPAPEVMRAVATTVRTAASPLADHMAR